jgi:hypothetical protein
MNTTTRSRYSRGAGRGSARGLEVYELPPPRDPAHSSRRFAIASWPLFDRYVLDRTSATSGNEASSAALRRDVETKVLRW